jgi:dihydroxyacetone kinase-like predicted kinase
MTTMGGGMASVTDNGTMHVHLLTDEPGTAISKAAAIGQLIDIKLENLRKEELMKERTMKAAENEAVKFSEPPKEVGFVAVSIGEGLGNIFRDLGCDVLIEGGQTMNPSTDDVIRAIEKVNAATVFVFPNNKNIILAATQAQSLVKDKKVIVIPTKTIPQGITALINYLPDQSPEENEKAMYEEISLVRTGQLTYAVRDTHIDDKEIHQCDFMGVGDKGILAVGTDLAETALETVRSMVDDTSELISIYYGDQIPEEDAQVLSDRIAAENPSCEVELNAGGQPIYYYIISVE